MKGHDFRRSILAISCAAVMVCSVGAMAQEREPADPGAMAADILFVRPIALVGSVVGAAFFLVSLPFTLPSRSTGDAASALVVDPLEYTFNRPLGVFDRCGAEHHPCGDGVR